MLATFRKTSPTFKRVVISKGQLAVAGVLLVGVIVLGYGYFQLNKVGFYLGLIVILAGVLNGLMHIMTRRNR